MSAARFLLGGVGGLVAVLFALYSSPRHSGSNSSLSPRFDGRDTGSTGEYYQNAKKMWIYYQEWVPEGGDVKGVVVIVHGYGEHCERYVELAQAFNKHGIAVYALDQQGHGRSEGDRVHVERFEDYTADGIEFVNMVVAKNPKKKIFLLGHSMGGLIGLDIVLSQPNTFSGVVLSSPALAIPEEVAVPALVKIGGFLSKYLPKLPLPGQRIDIAKVSHRQDVQLSYKNDPLVYHGVFKARQVYEFLQAMPRVLAKVPKLTHPLLLIHGRNDALTSVAGSEMVEKTAGSKDKTAKYYDLPYLHELLHEQDVKDEVVSWVKKHL